MLKCKNKTPNQGYRQLLIFLTCQLFWPKCLFSISWFSQFTKDCPPPFFFFLIAVPEGVGKSQKWCCSSLTRPGTAGPVRDLNLLCLCPRAQDMVCSSAMLSFLPWASWHSACGWFDFLWELCMCYQCGGSLMAQYERQDPSGSRMGYQAGLKPPLASSIGLVTMWKTN